MKALSLRPEWAMPVLLGLKTIECRTWKTAYRGNLLICSSARKTPATIAGKALCIVTLDEIEPFTKDHMFDAYMEDLEQPQNAYAWHLSNLRWVKPFDVKGKLNFYEVEDSKVNIISEELSNHKAFERFYMPLMYWGKEKDLDKRFMTMLDDIWT